MLLKLTRDEAAAEDLLQETFLAAWSKLDGFKGQVPFRAWLFRIGLNKFRSWYRWRRVWGLFGLETVPEARQPLEAGPEVQARDHNLKKRLDVELAALPPRQKEAVLLRVQGMEMTEIAHAMGISEGAAKAHLSLGRSKLQKQLESLA